MKTFKTILVTLMMCLVTMISFAQCCINNQKLVTNNCSLDPTSKWNVVEWGFSDKLITYQYKHPKMIKLVGGDVHRLEVTDIRLCVVGDEQTDKIYYCHYGDVKSRITLTKNIVIFETFDTFSNVWSKMTFY